MDFQSNYSTFPNIPVLKSKESNTVPDMSYTPREIIAKFSRGEKVPLGFRGVYDSEDSKLDGYDPAIFEDDPTRDPSFDFGDYVEEKNALKERQAELNRRSKVKADLESKRKASAEEMSASDSTMRETTSGEAKSAPNDSN